MLTYGAEPQVRGPAGRERTVDMTRGAMKTIRPKTRFVRDRRLTAEFEFHGVRKIIAGVATVLAGLFLSINVASAEASQVRVEIERRASTVDTPVLIGGVAVERMVMNPCPPGQVMQGYLDNNSNDEFDDGDTPFCTPAPTTPPTTKAPAVAPPSDSGGSGSDGSSSGSGASSDSGGSGSSNNSRSGSTSGGSSAEPRTQTPSFRQRIEERCAGETGDGRLTEGLEIARDGGDHNRVIVLAELCALTFGESDDPDLGRPLSNLEQAIADGEYSITVNEDMLRLVQAYSSMAWGAGERWAELAPGADLQSDQAEAPAEPAECYFSPRSGQWLTFDQEGGVVTYVEPTCDGEVVATGAFVVAADVEQADPACVEPTPLADELIPAAPADWHLCNGAA